MNTLALKFGKPAVYFPRDVFVHSSLVIPKDERPHGIKFREGVGFASKNQSFDLHAQTIY